MTELIKAHLHAAEGYAKLSKAKRKQVGAAIVKDGRVISVGYNGTPSRWDNCCEDDNGLTIREVLHAETNAILFAAKYGVATNNCMMVTTLSPCLDCAKLIYQAGIMSVRYRDLHSDSSGIEFLIKCGVDICQIK